jgi:Heterokaryon incompatibility protein (HET)
MGDQKHFKYNTLGEKEIRLFKIDITESDTPLSGQLVTFRHPCHFEVNWKNYAGMFRNWNDMRLTEKSGDEYGYDALSYAWGDPEPSYPFALRTTGKFYRKGRLESNSEIRQQGTIHIRSNLFALLKQLRSIKYNRFIWIDSICIDQGNDSEKSIQISLMRHIYKEAKNVLIWLGDASAAEEGAIAIMPAIARILEQAAAEGPEIRAAMPETFDAVGLPPPSHPVWPALGTLMNRAWFRRLWTLQEVVLPEKTRVLCGQREISWAELAFFGATVAKNYRQRIINWTITGDSQIDTTELHGYDAIRVVNYCREALKASVMGVPLCVLLCATRRRQAANPVDMIFGMLGMAAPGLTKELAIDVSARPKDVYLAFAKYYIRHEVNECLLNHTTSRDNVESLPSWCPNFGSPETVCSLGSRWWNDCIVGETSNSQNYSAGFTPGGKWSIPIIDHLFRSAMGAAIKQRTPTQDFYDTLDPRQISLTPNPNHIRASGISVDVVAQIVPCNPGAENFAIDLSSTRKTWEWESLCLALAKDNLEDAADIPEAYWRTLIANQTGGKVGQEDIIWDRFEKVDMREKYHKWKVWMEDVIQKGEIFSFVDFTEHRTRWFGMQVSRLTRGRCFFATRDGRIGLGPSDTQVGDAVCVFFYCPTPYILRHGPSVHRFVGEAYVHGIMHAQALDMLDQGILDETQFIIG